MKHPRIKAIQPVFIALVLINKSGREKTTTLSLLISCIQRPAVDRVGSDGIGGDEGTAKRILNICGWLPSFDEYRNAGRRPGSVPGPERAERNLDRGRDCIGS